MSQHQKENLVSLISTLTASTFYIIYVFNRYFASEFTSGEELKYWASAILLIIPIRIAIQIIVYIGFKITEGIFANGKIVDEVKDERDNLIELKGDRFSTNIFVFGFIFAMIGIVFFESSLSAMFAIILVSGYFGELFGIFAKIYFYKKGI